MVEARNFVEKTLGKSLDPEKNVEISPKAKEKVPTYTPPPQPIQEPLPPQVQIIQQPVIQVVEKIVYKKQRIHGFFRTLTIIALLVIGFLMLGESTGLISLSINSFKLHQIFPIIIILSTIIIRSYKGIMGKIFGLILFLAVFGGIFTISVYTSLNPSSKRESGNVFSYDVPHIKNNFYLETLIGNTNIKGSNKSMVEGTRNSDRNLLVSSGKNANIGYLKLDEESNRNILQNYVSNIDLSLPNSKAFDLLYIKNLFGSHTIDLTDLQRNIFKFHGGIDDITIQVGNVESGNKIEIQGTAANVNLDIPKDIGVMMYYKHLAGMLKTPDFDVLSGHYFQSKNIATSKATLNIYINLGAGNTEINRIEPKL